MAHTRLSEYAELSVYIFKHRGIYDSRKMKFKKKNKAVSDWSSFKTPAEDPLTDELLTTT